MGTALGIDYAQVAFLPLTNAVKVEQQQQQQKQQPQQEKQIQEARNQTSSDSYWEWQSSDVVEDDVCDTSNDLFSVSLVESNLIREAEMLQETLPSAATVNTVERKSNDDDYWAEKVENDLNDEYDVGVGKKNLNSAAPQQLESMSYWDWPSVDAREVQINLILRDEYARQQVSVETIQRCLLEDRKKMFSIKKCSDQQKASSDSYWVWESPIVAGHAMEDDNNNIHRDYWVWDTSSAESKASCMIQSILEKESIRQLLRVEHIERGIIKDLSSRSLCNKKPTLTCDDYWSWQSSEELEDAKNYWNWSPVNKESYWIM